MPHLEDIHYASQSDMPWAAQHPGRFIQARILDAFAMSQTELAKRLGVTKQSVSQLVQGKRAVSTEMAMRLSALTKQSVAFWLDMQMQFDLWELRDATFTEQIKPLEK